MLFLFPWIPHFSDHTSLRKTDFLGRGKEFGEERASLMSREEEKQWAPKDVVLWGGVIGHVLGRIQPEKKKCMNMFWNI